LFAVKTKATKVDKGWRINGSKIWTSNAHIADFMIALFRTSPPPNENRRHGLTQFLVDMKTRGIKVNPIYQMSGQHDFNEVVFEDVFVPDDHVLGEIDGAWKQATSELAYERSGPERFLETFYVLLELIRAIGREPDARSADGLGRLVAQLHTLRRMSVSVAGMLQAGTQPVVEAAIVKDLATVWEQKLPNRVRDVQGLRGRILETILSHPFAGKIYPVNRGANEVQGLKAYSSVDVLPEPADLAILIIPAQYIASELERCGRRRIKAAVILSSGFA